MTLEFTAQVPERDFDVSLAVADGETLALLGPNGAGKSTLLAVVAGLLRPATARVSLDGRDLTHTTAGGRHTWVTPHDRQIALLAQDPLLFPHLSVRDNIGFGVRAHGQSRSASRAEADRWLAQLGLTDLAHRRPAALSGGQAQRVAIARALAAQPRLLLLDEPMAALDVDAAPEVRQFLKASLAGRSAIVVTHDVLDAVLLADRVAVLEAGRLVELGATEGVLTRPRSAFAARIAGLNLLRGTWTGAAVRLAGGDLVHGRVRDAPSAEGAPMVAVCRPAAVAVYAAPVAGSPRNLVTAVVTAIEPIAGLIRVRTDALTADITPAALADLGLAVGQRVWLSVKATEVDLYPS